MSHSQLSPRDDSFPSEIPNGPLRGGRSTVESVPNTVVGGSDMPPDRALDPWRTLPPAVAAAGRGGRTETADRLAAVSGPEVVPAVISIAGYEIQSVLGRGAMGVVYKARQMSLGRLVALKMVLSGDHAGAEDRARFLAEAEAVAALQHPNIVQVYEVGEHEGLPFFSMEIVSGGNLEGKSRGNLLPPSTAAALMEKVALAMHYAHQQGVVHRDLKPANVLLTPDGEPKITDFGLAKRLQPDPNARGSRYATQTGTAVGTPSYMAPEQASGHGKLVGPKADVYSLGAMLYEMLTGRPPFVADTAMDTLLLVVTEEPPSPSRLQPRLPRELVTITLKCLCKEPERRYCSAGELADDLRRFLEGEPIHAVPAGRWERLVKWARRRPAAAALVGVSTAAALALLCGGLAYQIKLNHALAEAKAERLEAVRRLVRLNVQTGMDLADGGRLPSALPNLVEALRLSTEMRADLNGPSADSITADERMHRMRLAMVLRSCPRLLRAWFHRGQALDAAFSPDGRRVITAGTDHLARIWDVASGGPVGPPLDHGSIIFQASFSPDGSRALTAGDDGTARVWDVGSGRELCRSPGHDGGVLAATFSPDGGRFCTAGTDGTARICSSRDGRQLLPTMGHPAPVRVAAFSPDGRWLLTAAGSAARLWDAANGAPTGPEFRHDGEVLTAAFDPRSAYLVTGGEDSVARLWSVADGAERKPALRHERAVAFACFSPDGKRVATSSNDGTALVWWAASGEPATRRMVHRDRINHLTFSPDGRFVATGSSDNTGVIWDADTGAPVSHAMTSNGNILRVQFSPDGRNLLTASESGVVRLWLPVHAYRKPRPTESRAPAPPTAKSRDGRLEVVSVDRHTLQVREAGTGRSVGRAIRSVGDMNSAAFDPAGGRLLTTSSDGIGQVWDAETGLPLSPPLSHGSPAVCGVFCPDGTRVATGSSDNTSRVWDAATGEPQTPFMKHEGSVYRLAFTPDGLGLLTFSEDGSARVWDTRTGERLTPVLDPEGWAKQAYAEPNNTAAWKLSIDERPIDEMRTVAEWVSGSRINEQTGDLVPNTTGRFRELSEEIRARFPEVIRLSPDPGTSGPVAGIEP